MNESQVQVQSHAPNFFGWWLIDQPLHWWNLSRKITHSVLVYFSIPILLKTLFAPWKRDVHMPVNASLDIILKTMADNLISRGIGFIVRFFTILIGLFATVAVFIATILIMLFWLLLPVVIGLILYWGWK